MVARTLRPALALLVFGLAASPGRASSLAEAPCRLERAGLPAAFAQCSTLSVPENPAAPEGPMLELFVARVPALTATPAADPLVLVNGGPGGSTVDLYLQGRGAFEPVLRDRDIVLLDQRGTGRSLAGLTCDVPSDFELDIATPEEIRVAVTDCIAAFPRDPRLFTTSVAVQDLERLRLALGVETINLYGVSYGTRVVQHYLRRFPDSVRAAVLDGIVPAELVLGPAIAADAQSALDAIFARCTADASCAARFGDLDGKFRELQRRFDGDSIELVIGDPQTGEPKSFELGEQHLQAVARLMSYADATAALLPLVIDEAHKGNFEPLAMQADLLIESVSDSIGFAMHNSVVCTEDAPYFDEAEFPAGAYYLGTTIIDGLRAICELWPAGVLDPDFKAPVASAKPVLLLSGENDPVTPPDYAERVIAGGLANSRHIVGAGKGHGLVAVGCVPRLLRDFLATASVEDIDAACLANEPPMPFFLSFQGPAP